MGGGGGARAARAVFRFQVSDEEKFRLILQESWTILCVVLFETEFQIAAKQI